MGQEGCGGLVCGGAHQIFEDDQQSDGEIAISTLSFRIAFTYTLVIRATHHAVLEAGEKTTYAFLRR